MKFLSYFALSLYLTCLMIGTFGKEDTIEQRRINLVGGYSSSESRNNNTDVQAAANFVLKQLQSHQGDYRFKLPSGSTNSLNVVVLDSQQQVVAGMNYRLKLGIFERDECLGGLSCIVYRDLQGKFTVTSFGEELSCQSVLAMRSVSTNSDSDEEEEEQDDEEVDLQ